MPVCGPIKFDECNVIINERSDGQSYENETQVVTNHSFPKSQDVVTGTYCTQP